MYIAFDRQEAYNTGRMKRGVPITGCPGGRQDMPASKAQQKAVSKYMKANYDVYQIRMPKGRKDVIKAHADAQGESVNSFINRAIDETMERDGGKA